jgi:hypothetical protein
MPLDLYWRLESKTKPKALIEKLRQQALDLPFVGVSEMVHLVGDETIVRMLKDGRSRASVLWPLVRAQVGVVTKPPKTAFQKLLP